MARISGEGNGEDDGDHDDDANVHDEDDGGDGGVDDDGDAGSVQFVCIAHSTCHSWLNELLTGWVFSWLAAEYEKKKTSGFWKR